MIVCRFCGGHFEPKPPHFKREKYCSDECRTSRTRAPVEFEVNAETIRERFDYDEPTGILKWKPRTLRPECARLDKAWNTRLAGTSVGVKHRHGHLYASINYKHYAVHRLIWLYVHGRWPSRVIDHINGNPSDNRISNLRECTQLENMRNSRLRTDNTSGVKGVYWEKKERKWMAYINVNGKMKALGRFAAKEDAIASRTKAEAEFFGAFARVNDLVPATTSAS